MNPLDYHDENPSEIGKMLFDRHVKQEATELLKKIEALPPHEQHAYINAMRQRKQQLEQEAAELLVKLDAMTQQEQLATLQAFIEGGIHHHTKDERTHNRIERPTEGMVCDCPCAWYPDE